MPWTQDDLDRINKSLASGTLSVAYRDRSVTYRSLEEMKQIRSMIRAEVESATSGQRGKFVTADKGYQ